MTLDRRTEFKDEVWQAGYLLCTRTTRWWNAERIREANEEEERCAFVFFSSEDEGRSRQLVFKFNTKEECAVAIHEHNLQLKCKKT